MVIINSFVPPESPIRLELKNVEALLDKTTLGKGDLFVSENTLCWKNDNNDGFSLGYFDISMHGISKDSNLHNKECIYIVTEHFNLPGYSAQEIIDSEADEDFEEEPEISEIFLIPDNQSLISIIYEAVKECQELNPDPNDSVDSDRESDFNPFNDEVIDNDLNSDMDTLSIRARSNGFTEDPYENDDVMFEDAD